MLSLKKDYAYLKKKKRENMLPTYLSKTGNTGMLAMYLLHDEYSFSIFKGVLVKYLLITK